MSVLYKTGVLLSFGKFFVVSSSFVLTQMTRVYAQKQRRSEAVCPVWQVLRNLPFLRELPSAFLDSLLGRGTMLKFDRGQVLPQADLHIRSRRPSCSASTCRFAHGRPVAQFVCGGMAAAARSLMHGLLLGRWCGRL